MKKLSLLFLIIATICFCSFTTFTALAEESAVDSTTESTAESTNEGETANESVFSSEVEEIVESTQESVLEGEEEPKYNLTEEELKKIIDSALTENQKSFVTSISTTLNKFFGWSTEKIYLIVALGILAFALIIFAIGKYISKTRANYTLNEQLKALSAYAEEAEKDKAKYKDLVDVLSKDGIEGVVNKACDELEAKVISSLKLDSDTIGDLLSKGDLNTAYLEKVVSALKVLAQDAGKTAMLNELSDAPTSAVVKRLEVENEKLKSALGEDAVQKILS